MINLKLTKIVDLPVYQELYVSNIFQKSFIEVNEEGTKAAAATTAIIKMALTCPRYNRTPIDFVTDHPLDRWSILLIGDC